MDDDVKTLLAILALVYGSSNGIGLLKDALDPVETNTKDLDCKMGDPQVAPTMLRQVAWGLFKSLWKPFVLIYLVMVLIVPTFLFIVALRGPVAALALIGLANSSNQTSSSRPSTFYWILFALSIVATMHYLSKYFKAWAVLIKYLRSKSPDGVDGA
ncbi:MAG TPA: hypothetical protein VN956_11805 [Pyrinomonadaceae bacterium]|nr:hypothetical protein [Pyrinomonadaceae bacterium]